MKQFTMMMSYGHVRRLFIDFVIRLFTPFNAFILAFIFGLAFLMFKTIKIHMKRRQYRHIPGPATNGIFEFYFGNIGRLRQMLESGQVYSDLLLEYQQIYGDTFKYQLFDDVIVFTIDPETIKNVLVVKNFPKDAQAYRKVAFPFNERFLGYGLVTEPNFDKWRKRRAIFNHGFSRGVLMDFVHSFNQTADILMDKLRRISEGNKPVCLATEMNHATLDAIAKVAFGMEVNSINEPDNKFSRYITKTMIILEKSLQDPLAPFKFKSVKQAKHMIRFLREAGKAQFYDRLNAFQSGDHMANDVLSNILNCHKLGSQNMDIEKMVDDFVTFFLAGQETTANTLAFAFLEIGKNPEVIDKLRNEVDQVLGQKSEVTYQDIAEMKYCAAVFKEALRLWPPVSNLTRLTNEEIYVQGYKIPVNTTLQVSTYVNARQAKYFKDPLAFRPERFIKDSDFEIKSTSPYVYLPFSLGPRSCIGQNFALIEGIIMISKLIQRFGFRLDPTQSNKAEQVLTLKPADGTRCFLTPRS